jgi:hypothetical protein
VKKLCGRFENSMMPCFWVCVGRHSTPPVHGKPGPILRAVGSKSDGRCVPCQRAPFFWTFLLSRWQEAIFIEVRFFVQ